MNEPDFLDLDAVPVNEDKNVVLGTLPVGTLPEHPFDAPEVSAEELQAVLHDPTEALAPSTLLGRAAHYGAHLGSAAVEALKEEEEERVGKLKDRITAAHQIAAKRVGLKKHFIGRSGSGGVGSQKGDEALPDLDSEDAQPPEVEYKKDVVLDMDGYHSRERSDQTVMAEDDRPALRDVVGLAVQNGKEA